MVPTSLLHQALYQVADLILDYGYVMVGGYLMYHWLTYRHNKSQAGSNVPQSVVTTLPTTSNLSSRIIMLKKSNFVIWKADVTLRLEKQGLVRAIEEPLPPEDAINRQALVMIAESISESLEYVIGNSAVAYDAMNKVDAEFGKLSYSALSDLEEDIKAMTLTKLDEKSIEDHLDALRKRIQQMINGGAVIDRIKQLKLMAATLPKDIFSSFVDSVKFGNQTAKEAEGMIRDKCRELRASTGSDLALLAKPKWSKSVTTKETIREQDRKEGRCFYCHNKDKNGNAVEKHLRVNCPFLANKVTASQYGGGVCSVYSSQTNYEDKTWILDSGATKHFNRDGTRFENYKPCSGSSVNLANGSSCVVQGSGTINVATEEGFLELKNVKHAPDFDSNLMSVGQLVSNGCQVLLNAEEALVSSQDGQLLLRAPMVNNLYTFTEVDDKALSAKVINWHERLGHPGADKMKTLSKLHPELDLTTPDNCETCLRTKLKQYPYKLSPSRAEYPLDLVHTDLCGPMKVTGIKSCRYFMVLQDDYSKYTTVAALENKEAVTVLAAFTKFKSRMETQLERKIKKVRSDNGLEFSGVFNQFLIENGIEHEYSVASCHQQNGAAERTIQTVESYTRRLMFDSCLPACFWPLAVKAATYLMNRTPHDGIDKETPFHALFGTSNKNELENLHVFGSVAYRWIHPEQRHRLQIGKFDPPTEKLVFVGYAENADAYLLLDPQTGRIIKERNVKIIDGVCPYRDKRQSINTDCKCKCTCTQSESLFPEQTSGLNHLTSDDDSTVQLPAGQPSRCSDSESDPRRSDPSSITSIDNPEDRVALPLTARGAPQSVVSPPIEIPPDTVSISPDDNTGPESPIVRRSGRKRRPIKRLQASQLGQWDEHSDSAQVAKSDVKSEPTLKPIRELKLISKMVTIPKTYDQAVNTPRYGHYWNEAANDEMRSFHEHNVFTSVPREEWMRPITTKWTFDAKLGPGGVIERLKARLVARGFNQRDGIDYGDVFSPVVCAAAIRLLLTLAGILKFKVHQVDVKTAFLHGDIDRELYVEPAPGYEEEGMVWKLNKSLYGLKQAPLCWYQKMTDFFAQLGFQPLKKERSIFVGKINGATVYLVVYVDDILILAKDEAIIQQVKDQISQLVEIRDLGQIRRFLGMNFTCSSDGSYISVSQGDHIDELVETCGLTNAKPMRKLPQLDTIPLHPIDEREIDHSLPIRNIVGSLLYIANMTRPDIASAASYLSRHLSQPTHKLLKYSKMVVNYLKTTKEKELYLGNLDGTNLTAFADANFAPEGDRKSQSGGLMKLGGSPIVWYSRKQDTVSQSSTESEYISLATMCKEVLWIQEILNEIDFPVQYPTVIHEDNQPAIAVAKGQKSGKATKHLDTKYHLLEDNIVKGKVDVVYLETGQQLADALTKVNSSVHDVTFLLGAPPKPATLGSGGVLVKDPIVSDVISNDDESNLEQHLGTLDTIVETST